MSGGGRLGNPALCLTSLPEHGASPLISAANRFTVSTVSLPLSIIEHVWQREKRGKKKTRLHFYGDMIWTTSSGLDGGLPPGRRTTVALGFLKDTSWKKIISLQQKQRLREFVHRKKKQKTGESGAEEGR